MGIKLACDNKAGQEGRLKIKELDQQMKRLAVVNSGLSPWEAQVLVEEIGRVYFQDPELKQLQAGQMKYACVSASEGPGKPLSKCQMQTVILTLLDHDDDHRDLPSNGKQAAAARRQRAIMRLTEEAREQGGYLTQEDLALILRCDVRTVRHDIKVLREQSGIVVATRGQQKDIGPGVSHRGMVVRMWLEGKEPVEIMRGSKHSLKAVENYLEKFKRVAYLRDKQFDDYQVALTVGISVSAAKTYAEIANEFRHKSFYRQRLAEIDLVGKQYYLAEGEKKDLPLHSGMTNAIASSWRKA